VSHGGRSKEDEWSDEEVEGIERWEGRSEAKAEGNLGAKTAKERPQDGNQRETRKNVDGNRMDGRIVVEGDSRADKEVEQGEEQRTKWKVMVTITLTRNKAQLFPTTRQPIHGEIQGIEFVEEDEVESWFSSTGLRGGEHLDKRQRAKAKRLLYTWGDVFETDLVRIRKTDLFEHAIVLNPGAVPYRARIPLYTEEERAFC